MTLVAWQRWHRAVEERFERLPSDKPTVVGRVARADPVPFTVPEPRVAAAHDQRHRHVEQAIFQAVHKHLTMLGKHPEYSACSTRFPQPPICLELEARP